MILNWSGKRGSNSRPQPWQGCALPAELFPLLSWLIYLWIFVHSRKTFRLLTSISFLHKIPAARQLVTINEKLF